MKVGFIWVIQIQFAIMDHKRMLTRSLLLLIGMAFIGSISFAQKVEEKIVWSEGRPLTWNDFKGAKKRTINSAMSIFGIMYEGESEVLSH
jgi:hypothetical protein